MTRPLIFSAPMVRALLDGRKTMTRRVLKPQPYFDKDGLLWWHWSKWAGSASRDPIGSIHEEWLEHLPYVVGDRLWVREAWQDCCPLWHFAWCGCGSREMMVSTHRPVYRGDPIECQKRGPEDKEAPPLKWRSPIHMPRWASRRTLIVENVRVERLQEITEADAEREGVEKPILPHWPGLPFRSAFRGLWLDLHGPVSWEANPWVAVIGFRVVRANIDAPSASARITSTE